MRNKERMITIQELIRGTSEEIIDYLKNLLFLRYISGTGYEPGCNYFLGHQCTYDSIKEHTGYLAFFYIESRPHIKRIPNSAITEGSTTLEVINEIKKINLLICSKSDEVSINLETLNKEETK